MKIKLSKTLKVGERDLSEIDLALDSLTGADFLKAVREATSANGGAPIIVYALDAEVQLQVAAMAAGVEPATLRALPMVDCAAALQAVSTFLLAAG